MVIRSRRGSSSLGCLLWLLGFAVALYYGVNVGQRYFLFHQLQDAMRSQARLAPGLTDAVIRRRLTDKIDELGLNIDPRKVRIQRRGNPPRIRIETQYADTVSLPLMRRIIVFTPTADAPL